MLQTINNINWKKIAEESNHVYLFLRGRNEDYTVVPRLLTELANGTPDDELYETIFGEIYYDMDGKLFQLMLPFLWEIVIEASLSARDKALFLIDEAFVRMYQGEKEKYRWRLREQGIDKPLTELLGNDPAASFAKLKTFLSEELYPETHSPAINILSFISDYRPETIALFQSLLGKAEAPMDEIILTALGRSLYRAKLPLTPEFAHYLEDEGNSHHQYVAATWIMNIEKDNSPVRAKDINRENENKFLYRMPLDRLPEKWYGIDYGY